MFPSANASRSALVGVLYVEAVAVSAIACVWLAPLAGWEKFLFALLLSLAMLMVRRVCDALDIRHRELVQRVFFFELTHRIAIGATAERYRPGQPISFDWDSAIAAAAADISKSRADSAAAEKAIDNGATFLLVALAAPPAIMLARLYAGIALAALIREGLAPGTLATFGLWTGL